MKTVMVFGTFDILHLGHIDLFKQAKALGGRLIVVVSRDARAESVKGSVPKHSEKERRDLLLHVDLVDEVVLGDPTDVYDVIEQYKPDILALGYDQEAFVEKLTEELQNRSLSPEIVRMKSHHPNRYKSSKIYAGHSLHS